MVDQDIQDMYKQILTYVRSKQEYLNDPSVPAAEFGDISAQDLTSIVDLIQRQIKRRPSIGEAATVRAYRDFTSASAEYAMRLNTRADYWADAALEGDIDIAKWDYNRKATAILMGATSNV